MKTFYLLSTLTGIFIFSLIGQGCQSGKKSNKQANLSEQTSSQILQIDDLLGKAETLNGQEIEAEGVCTHICAHGGGKIFLMGSDDTQTIRVEAGEKIGSFKQETVNNIVRVKGKLVEDRIDEAYLAQWEEMLKSQTAPKHGNDEAGCSSEQKAQGETMATTQQERIENFRKRIAERKEKEGKDYLSFYHIEADTYTIL